MDWLLDDGTLREENCLPSIPRPRPRPCEFVPVFLSKLENTFAFNPELDFFLRKVLGSEASERVFPDLECRVKVKSWVVETDVDTGLESLVDRPDPICG